MKYLLVKLYSTCYKLKYSLLKFYTDSRSDKLAYYFNTTIMAQYAIPNDSSDFDKTKHLKLIML